MKQREKCSGPGFDAGRSTKSIPYSIRYESWPGWYAFDGPELVSTGQQVNEWTAR